MEIQSVFEKRGNALNGKFRYISMLEFLILGILIFLLGFWGQRVLQPSDSAILNAISYQVAHHFPYLWFAVIVYRWMSDGRRCYWVDGKEVSYRVGWLTPSVVTLPSKRIQHVEIKQGFFDRLFNLYRVCVLSAGRGFTIPGLDKVAAETLRSQLLDNVVHEDD